VDKIYPAGPAAFPAELTRASVSYRRSAWLAMFGLAGFGVVYMGLTGFFLIQTWKAGAALLAGHVGGLFVALLCGFLAVFMVKPLFLLRRGGNPDDLEITAAEQPRLFEFLHRLADETGAQRPHRVVLAPDVNAAVFYDLSLLNFLLPTRKNLMVGLGLVNALTLGEFKAVLAHEFGHFTQRSMAVGNWVYVSRQLAGHIVARRDALDHLLSHLSGGDLRIAWIGWTLRLIVWSVRSLVDTLFRAVILSQRALSREMEFQADRVAVSVTGSDAVVHGLFRLAAADEAWDLAMVHAEREAAAGRLVPDVFALQTRIDERVRVILDKPDLGVPPPVPATAPERHRVFAPAFAAPPRMWATHPSNVDREEAAKRLYVAAPLDDRSAWALFVDADALRARVTRHVLPPTEGASTVSCDEALARLDASWTKAHLDPRYRGAYLGRSLTRGYGSAKQMAVAHPAPERTDVLARLAALYPPAIADLHELLERLSGEYCMLRAVADGRMEAAGGVLRFRGAEVPRSALPVLLANVGREVEETERQLDAHLADARSAHLDAAALVDGRWVPVLRGLHALLHLAEHAEADLEDARQNLDHVYFVVTADGRVSGRERKRLVKAAAEVQGTLMWIYHRAAQVDLGPEIAEALEVGSFAEAIGTLDLHAPNADNLADWLQHGAAYVAGVSAFLRALRTATLIRLLTCEVEVAGALQRGETLAPTAAVPRAPAAEFRRGQERVRTDRLSVWDRFQMAEGRVAAVARFVAASLIVGGVVSRVTTAGEVNVHVLNGREEAITVAIGGTSTRVGPGQVEVLRIGTGDETVEARESGRGFIERFDVSLETGYADVVYNVGGTAALVEWTAIYGNARPEPVRDLGHQRWFETKASIILRPPPTSSRARGGAERLTVVSALGASETLGDFARKYGGGTISR
jgi:Zn-dependent protease with chaperone function